VVSAWRARDRELIARGVELTLVSPVRWNEGGRDVALEPGEDRFVVPARTLGRHPYLFVYDPRPLVRELRRRKLDVLDVHEEPASLAAFELRLLARLFQPGVPMVLYGAQNIAKRYPPPFRWIERASLRRAAGTYPCNEAAGRIFRRKGFTGVVATLPLGVDVDRFAPATGEWPPGPLRVGYVGRLEPHKGVHVLLEAVAGLDEVTVAVHGDGPAAGDLVALADRLGVAGRVRFCGFAAHDTLPEVYRSFDVLAVPSLTTPSWTEQFGRVAVEGMASGLAVVASTAGALPEVVGDAGVLVPEGDVAAWRTALARLAAEPAERVRLGALARERARRFTWAAVAGGHLALYQQVRR
jgi:glycosyltransferase involved in cell wall biosynthesis